MQLIGLTNMRYFKNKIQFVFTILILICIFFISRYFLKITTQKSINSFISISTTFDYSNNGKTLTKIYNENMKVIATENINWGNYYHYIKEDDFLYFFGGKSILSVDSVSGKSKVYENIIEKGSIDMVNNQGEKTLFISNIGMITENNYTSEVCEIVDFSNFETRSFKTDNSLALDAIYLNEKYYVVSRDFNPKTPSRMLEIYDNNMELIKKEPLDYDCSFYRIYRKNDNLYVIGTISNDNKIKIIDINDDTPLLVSEHSVPNAEIFINQSNEELYFSNDFGVYSLNVNNDLLKLVFDSNQIADSNTKENTFSYIPYFSSNSNALRVVIRSKKDIDKTPQVKFFVQDTSTGDFVPIKIKDKPLICIYYGKLE